MNDNIEIPESSPNELVTPAEPVRTLRTVIADSPTITRFVVRNTYPNRFEIWLLDQERQIVVPRTPRQPALQALRAYLRGGGQ